MSIYFNINFKVFGTINHSPSLIVLNEFTSKALEDKFIAITAEEI